MDVNVLRHVYRGAKPLERFAILAFSQAALHPRDSKLRNEFTDVLQNKERKMKKHLREFRNER